MALAPAREAQRGENWTGIFLFALHHRGFLPSAWCPGTGSSPCAPCVPAGGHGRLLLGLRFLSSLPGCAGGERGFLLSSFLPK